MKAESKRLIKHFVMKQLWDESYLEELRRDLGTYAMIWLHQPRRLGCLE